MESRVLYNNEEREIHALVDLAAPECDLRLNHVNGNMEVRANEIDIRFFPKGPKLIFQGERSKVMVIKHQYTKFIEKEQIKRG